MVSTRRINIGEPVSVDEHGYIMGIDMAARDSSSSVIGVAISDIKEDGTIEVALNGNGIVSFSTSNENGEQEERLRMYSNGNVGIGTHPPAEELHIITADNLGLSVNEPKEKLNIEIEIIDMRNNKELAMERLNAIWSSK